MDLVKALSSQYMKEELPEMRVGDTVRVHVLIKEGSRERVHAHWPAHGRALRCFTYGAGFVFGITYACENCALRIH